MKILRTVAYSSDYQKYISRKYKNFRDLSYQDQQNIIFDEYYGWGDTWDRVLSSRDGVSCKTHIINFKGHTDKYIKRGFSRIHHAINLLKKESPDIWLIFDRGYTSEELNLMRLHVPKFPKTVKWHGLSWEKSDVKDQYDLILTCLNKNHRHFSSLGIQSYYFKSYCDCDIKCDNDPKYASKILFCGSINSFDGAHFNRARIIESLLRERRIEAHIADLGYHSFIKLFYVIFKGLLIGKFSELKKIKYFKTYAYLMYRKKAPLFGYDYYSALISSRAFVNIDIDLAGEEAANLRLYECLTIGGRLITNHKKNIACLEDKSSLLLFHDMQDLNAILDTLPNKFLPHKLYKNNKLHSSINCFFDDCVLNGVLSYVPAM